MTSRNKIIPGSYTLDHYQSNALDTAKVRNLNYAILGLVGEAGEIANCFKKIERDNLDPDQVDITHERMREELGDVLWYVALIATELDTCLSDIALDNILKLRRRYHPTAQ